MRFKELSTTLTGYIEGIPDDWQGKASILEMKENGCRQWRQMEWIGFYFQYLSENVFKEIMEVPGPRYGNVSFDGFWKIPWDFKAHAMNTSSHKIIVNDKEAIIEAIKEYGNVGLILAMGEVIYNDDERSFQKWHSDLKGGKSSYEIKRIKRGAWSRLRKVHFSLKQVSFIQIDKNLLERTGSFQKNFRNADGSPRRAKVMLDLEKIDEKLVHFIEFKSEKTILDENSDVPFERQQSIFKY